MALPFRSIFGLSEQQGGSGSSTPANQAQDSSEWSQDPAGISDEGLFTIDAESLSAAIPPELRSGVTTHASKVTLRLDDAEVRAGGGEVNTRLAQIYRACPQLFNVAIEEPLDMPVNLRLANVEQPSAGTPSAPSAFPAVELDSEGLNPFRSKGASNPFVNPLVQPMQLPFGSKTSFSSLIAPPSIEKAEPSAVESPSLLSPFLAAITGAPVIAPADRVGGQEGIPASALPSLPVTEEASSPSATPEMKLSFHFHSLLAQVNPATLGINPAALPQDWKTHLPLSYLKPQFLEGRVVATLAKLIECADPAAKIGLQGINGTIEVNIPLKDIVRQLPSGELLPNSPFGGGPEKPVLASGVNPFLVQAQEEARRGFVPLAEAPPVRMDPTAPPVISPFRIAPVEKPAAAVAESVSHDPFTGAVIKPAKPLESLDELNLGNSRASLPPAPSAVTPGNGSPMPAPWMVPNATPVHQQSQIPPRTPPPATVPLPAAVPIQHGAPKEASWMRFDGVGFQPSVQDLELRAVFGRSESFTRQLAVELTAGLPGIVGCVLFSSTSGVPVLAQSVASSSEAAALLSRTPRMYERIRGLAEDLGFESGETFTLRTSQGVVGFFSQGGVCLSVLQSDDKADPGFWERLILVTRGMATLRE